MAVANDHPVSNITLLLCKRLESVGNATYEADRHEENKKSGKAAEDYTCRVCVLTPWPKNNCVRELKCLRIVSVFLDLEIFLTNMLVAQRIRAKTVQLLFSRLQIILLQNNLVCYLKIIYIYLFLKKMDAPRFLHFARSPSACTSYPVDRTGPWDY